MQISGFFLSINSFHFRNGKHASQGLLFALKWRLRNGAWISVEGLPDRRIYPPNHGYSSELVTEVTWLDAGCYIP
jgi:hypothetical protein